MGVVLGEDIPDSLKGVQREIRQLVGGVAGEGEEAVVVVVAFWVSALEFLVLLL